MAIDCNFDINSRKYWKFVPFESNSKKEKTVITRKHRISDPHSTFTCRYLFSQKALTIECSFDINSRRYWKLVPFVSNSKKEETVITRKHKNIF